MGENKETEEVGGMKRKEKERGVGMQYRLASLESTGFPLFPECWDHTGKCLCLGFEIIAEFLFFVFFPSL